MLSLAPLPLTRGTFTVWPGSRSFIPTVSGSYVATGGGNVYTKLDVDTELIDRELTTMLTLLSDETGSPPLYLNGLVDRYRGDQYQLGLVGLMTFAGAGPGPRDAIEQFGLIAQQDEPEVDITPVMDCLAAINEYRSRAEAEVARVSPDFQPTGEPDEEEWVFPLAEFEAQIGEINGAAACREIFSDSGTEVDFGFRRRSIGSGYEITMWADSGIYLEPRPETYLTVIVREDPGAPDPPVDLSPHSLFSLADTFAVTIAECGQLPWIYSNFMAGDNYYSPDGDFYSGPTFLDSDWLCEDQVPVARRN